MIVNYIKILLLLFIFCSSTSFGQKMKERGIILEMGKKFYAEAHFFPSIYNDSCEVIILYKFSNNTVSFIKSPESKRYLGKFYAVYQVDVEFRDADNIIRRRKSNKDTIFTDDWDISINGNDYTYGWIKTLVPNSDYTIIVELLENEVNKLKQIRIPKIEKKEYLTKEVISQPIFGYQNENNKDSILFYPFVLNNSIKFSSIEPSILFVVSYKDIFSKYNYTYEYIDQKNNILLTGQKLISNGVVTPKQNTSIRLSEKSKLYEIFFEYYNTGELKQIDNIYYGILQITLPVDKLLPGRYNLIINKIGTKDTSSFSFNVVWDDMPLSLNEPKYAARMMYYILTDEELDKLNTGNEKEIFVNIFNYWKKFDPTPESLYNEAMAEYFKRVDYAHMNFKTIGEADGAMTERGKIYILYGNPTTIDRELNTNNKNTEIWRYSKQKKEFIFRTDSNGFYVLTKINDL